VIPAAQRLRKNTLNQQIVFTHADPGHDLIVRRNEAG
jgi:hypothetical protein